MTGDQDDPGSPPAGVTRVETLDGLGRLVDRSLVVVDARRCDPLRDARDDPPVRERSADRQRRGGRPSEPPPCPVPTPCAPMPRPGLPGRRCSPGWGASRPISTTCDRRWIGPMSPTCRWRSRCTWPSAPTGDRAASGPKASTGCARRSTPSIGGARRRRRCRRRSGCCSRRASWSPRSTCPATRAGASLAPSPMRRSPSLAPRATARRSPMPWPWPCRSRS